MSKSRGNIVYPENLLRKGIQPYHLRFFLLYKHYRKKLNFTDEKFKNSNNNIDSIRMIVSDLLSGKGLIAKSNSPASELIGKIKDEFEKNMDDDLGFGVAIKNIFKILTGLKKMKDKNGLSLKNISQLKMLLEKIDSVAGVIF
jgi:cysteinyl-tRNA synthetase